ncbi:MAG: hypothetical protein NTY19_41965 [Planctomycetota bacterium]|nr:hypothetical protein [Planctomycetota bacterium]
MRNSLQFRLLVAFTLVILLTVGAVFFLMWQAATGQIQQFGDRVERMVINRIQFVITDYYLTNNNWEGVQPLVVQIGEQFRHRVILADADGVIIADSTLETPDQKVNLESFASKTLTSSHERRDPVPPETGGPPPMCVAHRPVIVAPNCSAAATRLACTRPPSPPTSHQCRRPASGRNLLHAYGNPRGACSSACPRCLDHREDAHRIAAGSRLSILAHFFSISV